MSDLGMANITMFFVIVGISLIFVITWIMKAESRVRASREEIHKLSAGLETSEREKFVLSERIVALESARASSGDAEFSGQDASAVKELRKKNDTLKEENRKLKSELVEAKVSLEEFYKALV